MRAALLLAGLMSYAAAAQQQPDNVDGAWVLRQPKGYMGIALLIQGEQFKYWSYSDVLLHPPVRYPLTGRIAREGDTLRLVPDQSGALLYDTAWRRRDEGGLACLVAARDAEHYRKTGEKLPPGLLICRDKGFNEQQPRMNWPRPPPRPVR